MERIARLVLGFILLFPGGLIPGAIWLVSFAISFAGFMLIAKALEK